MSMRTKSDWGSPESSPAGPDFPFCWRVLPVFSLCLCNSNETHYHKCGWAKCEGSPSQYKICGLDTWKVYQVMIWWVIESITIYIVLIQLFTFWYMPRIKFMVNILEFLPHYFPNWCGPVCSDEVYIYSFIENEMVEAPPTALGLHGNWTASFRYLLTKENRNEWMSNSKKTNTIHPLNNALSILCHPEYSFTNRTSSILVLPVVVESEWSHYWIEAETNRWNTCSCSL